MRRILLGGLGLALGVFAPPALAQQPTRGAQPARAASLGRPAAADPPPEPEITQTGLLRGGPPRPTVTYAPGSFGPPSAVGAAPVTGMPVTGTPVPGAPGYGVPVYGAPPVGMPMAAGQPLPSTPLNPPRVVPTAPPSVTESRGDPTGRVPMASPVPMYGSHVGPTLAPSVGPTFGPTFVPSVAPDGFDCPPGVEDPLFAGPPVSGTDRVARIGKGWVTAELLLWWARGQSVPPLVTTGTTGFGIVGQPDTRVLLGGSFGETFHVGGRIGAGCWFDCNECRGIDARLFWVSPNTASFVTSTNVNPLLARPFFNVNPTITVPNAGFGQSSEVVARPGVATGGVAVTLKSTVWGAEVNYRRHLAGGPGARLDGLIGYRFLDLREQLVITERFARTPDSDPAVGVPAVAGVITDSFRTTNRFHGGQVGVTGSFQRGRWTIDPRATIAFGTVNQTLDIFGGQQLTFANGATTVTPGGLLAVPGANIGRFSRDRFAVVPELGLNVGWQATERLSLFVGYNLLYLSSALRAGEVVDTRVDAARVPNLLPPGTATPLPGVVRPLPQFSTSGYFIQGISFGIGYRW